MHAVHIQFLMWPGVQTISVMTISFIYFVGVMGFGGVNVTTGVLIAFVGYANNFWNPVINIGNFYNQLITCSAYLERIFETLDVTPEIRNKPDAADLPQIRGRVDFNDVVFRYEKDGRNILNLVDFHVEPGRTIALVGPTGAGKTTIINLLSRFYDVSEGSVTIDGYDVRDVTLASLRRQMGVMLQDTFIFSGNVRENIRYGKLDATDEEIEAAAKAVHAHEFIMELPDGYDTVVEERGSTLSAGQRQLIAFARVLLADPRILILTRRRATSTRAPRRRCRPACSICSRGARASSSRTACRRSRTRTRSSTSITARSSSTARTRSCSPPRARTTASTSRSTR